MIQTTSLVHLAATYAPDFGAEVWLDMKDDSAIVKGKEGHTLLLMARHDGRTDVLYETGSLAVWPAYMDDLWLRAGGDGRQLVGQLLHRV